ncbi:uncharacterized protein [Dendrobates tinctorius]|uniref:uncharacterized protein n=1 Tax=Dendrobates tinctorius TaxID=92724 RepID=UPI003CC967B8
MRSWSGRIWVLSLMMLAALLQEGQLDETLQNSTSVTLWFDTKAATATFRVDLCRIVKCQWNLKFGKKSSNPNYKYLTGVEGAVVYICVTRPGNENCNSWSDAAWNTGTSWGYKPEEAMTRVSSSGKPLLKRMNIVVPIPKWGCDPEVLDWRFSCNPLLITLDEPSLGDEGLYVLGLYTPGRQVQQGTFWLKAVPAQDKEQEEDKPQRSGEMLDVDGIGELGYEEKLAVETGYTERNEWLLWMKYTTEQNNKTDCIACATARPHLGTIPLRYSEQDQVDLQCILALYNATYDPSDNVLCQSLSVRYPIAKIDQVPPRVYAYPGDYTCFLRTGPGRWVGNLTSEFCHNTIPINTDTGGFKASWFKNQTIARSDIWWLCGDMKLRPRLPPGWVGSCALVQVLMPFKIISSEEIKGGGMNVETLHRNRRSVPAGSFDPRVYIDNIGVPRGVPDEYKARNQIAADFESIFFWWVTINKNVDWINYIYYNQQRFINYTRDAVKGIAEQLGPTSLMTHQNRMALDMLLAEKGGVCKMFGTFCCTFIPNNTSPDGSITKALEGLTSLSEELAENSGINNPFMDWLESWFGRWSHLVSSLLISLAVVAAVLVTCGCCCIPCIRGLLQRLIDASITKTMYITMKPYNNDYEQMV